MVNLKTTSPTFIKTLGPMSSLGSGILEHGGERAVGKGSEIHVQPFFLSLKSLKKKDNQCFSVLH